MEQANTIDFGQQRIRQLLSGVPFFNEIARLDAGQFSLLEQRTHLWVAESGSSVIRCGDVDSALYFLLRGQLEVHGDAGSGSPLYYVSPGEVFGSLSMLLGTPRSASIRVADSAREAVLASLDFNAFNDDGSGYSLPTRLAFFHMIVHHIRWTLEVKRMQQPDHELVHRMRKIAVFQGEKGSVEELRALRDQARDLAELLCRWNEQSRANTGNIQLT